MKKPQFKLSTLLLLTAALAVVFAVCAQWPAKDFVAHEASGSNGRPYLIGSFVERPPTMQEWLIRVGISIAAIVIAVLFCWALYRGVRMALPAKAEREAEPTR